MQKRICFLAPTGYGKTTAVNAIIKKFDCQMIKIGQPLYELQTEFYNHLGIDIKDKQDGELLQFYGNKIRKESPDFLISQFIEAIKNSSSEIILNDDCRPADYKHLKNNEFIFIKIDGHRHDRDDHTMVDPNNKVEWQEINEYDYIIENKGTREQFERNVIELINMILKEEY